MEEHVVSPLAVSHLLQHTLRSLCVHENSQWVYAVFWRMLPRNYPPPKWDAQGGYDRSRGNRRNWILVWEDGFCNFAATSSSASYIANCQGLQPDLFFKMSHEIYSYGEGLIGKVAADHSHKWIYSEPNDQEISLLSSSSSWHINHSADIQPRTWEAQFQSGIKTIALIAVREGVVQLGAIHKVVEDLSCVVFLRKKFHYIERIPGVLLPHPSSSSSSSVCPIKLVDGFGESDIWQFSGRGGANPGYELYDGHSYLNHQLIRVTPSMSSLEALLSKLPSVVPLPLPLSSQSSLPLQQRQLQSISMEKVAKEEIDQELYVDETSTSISPPYRYHCQNQEF